MIFNIALIGRTNVGKSTLFNSLLKKNLAIVHNTINFTRDRQLGKLYLSDGAYVNIIDTAGIELFSQKHSILQTSILNQTFIAIHESDLVLFILNMQYGIIQEDYDLINLIRKQSKKIFLIINKIDKVKNYQYQINEYYCFGVKDIFLISAIKSFGVQKLKNKIQIWYNNLQSISYCTSKIKTNQLNNNLTRDITVCIIGKPNVGKSTLFNVLLKKNRSITDNMPGTTRDSIVDTITFQKKKYTIIDTAGIRKRNNNTITSLPVLKTLYALSKTCISIFIIDYHEGLNKQDIWILNIMIKSGKKVLILINKSEKLTSIEKKKIKNYLCCKYKVMNFFYIHFISALYQVGIKKIFYLINNLENNIYSTMTSSKLTKIMYQAIRQYPPKIVRGKKIKLQYAHPGGYNPPTIVIHGHQLLYITKNYQRYLVHFFQEHLGYFGSIVKIIFKK